MRYHIFFKIPHSIRALIPWCISSPLHLLNVIANVTGSSLSSDANLIILIGQVGGFGSYVSRRWGREIETRVNIKKRIIFLSSATREFLRYFSMFPLAPVKYCRHPGGPETSSLPHAYCWTLISHIRVTPPEEPIRKLAVWHAMPVLSKITKIKVIPY